MRRAGAGRSNARPARTARLIELLLDHNDGVDDRVRRNALRGLEAVVEQGNDIVHHIGGGKVACEHVVARVGGVRTAVELAGVEDGAQGIRSLSGLGLGNLHVGSGMR